MKPNIPTGEDGKPVHPISASALAPVVEKYKSEGKAFKMGMVFPVSTHNYELRYWLAAGGLHPGFYSSDNITGQIGADVFLSVTPPPQMPSTLEAGTIYGYCVGEPWNQQAVIKGIGVPVVTDYELWKNNPEKVFGITEEFAETNPNTTLAVVKALIRAAMWLDENDNANREEAVKILSRPDYVGADEEVIAASMTGTFEYEKGDVRDVPDFNVFFRYNATYPFYSDAGMVSDPDAPLGPNHRGPSRTAGTTRSRNPSISRKSTFRPPSSWSTKALPMKPISLGDSDGYKVPTPSEDIIDGIAYDGKIPNAYLESLPIGLKGDQVVVGTEVKG